MAALTPKELKVLEFIRNYVEQRGCSPTYQEIQTRFKYRAVSSVQQFIKQLIEKGQLKDTMGENKKRALELVESDEGLTGLRSIPLEGVVAAGLLREAVRQSEMVTVPSSHMKRGQEYFALKISGYSMVEDCILDGDTVVIRRQSTAQNGQVVVALVDGDATIKRFYKKNHGIELHPANPQFDVIQVSPQSDFKILGVLSSVIRTVE